MFSAKPICLKSADEGARDDKVEGYGGVTPHGDGGTAIITLIDTAI